MVIPHEYPRFDSTGRFPNSTPLGGELPGGVHHMRPTVILDMVFGLAGQLRTLAGSASNGAGKEPPATASPAPAKPTFTSQGMIKPSAHHKVAIDIHRQEWP